MSNESKHFKLWHQIADTGSTKEDAFTHLWRDDEAPENICFACEEAITRMIQECSKADWLRPGNSKCHYCPINWGARDCETFPSPYVAYNLANRVDDAHGVMDAAVAILDLDWNPSPEDIIDE